MRSPNVLMQRLSAADPARGAIVERDRAEALLERVLAVRQAPARAGPRQRPRRRRASFAIAVLVLLLLTAAALAAAGVIRLGAPAKSPVELTTPRIGLGAVRPGSARLLSVATPDPVGGPPWGIRVVSTTRGVGCIEVGRVLNGRLGAIGQDGAFGNDGRFHAFPSSGLFAGAVCGNLDANGRLFDTVDADVVPASGDPGDGSCVTPPPRGARILGPNASRICPAAQVRVLSYGLLGPEARRVTYTLDGHRHTLTPTGPEGAYLIVTTFRGGGRTPAFAGGSVMPLPWSSPIDTITYRDGTVCRIASTKPVTLAGQCKPPGYVPIRQHAPTHAQVEATIHARVVATPPASVSELGSRRAILVSFIARVAVTKASSAYELVEDTSSPQAVFVETKKDIPAGETVSWLLPAPMAGIYSGKVTLGFGVAPAYPVYTYAPGPVVGHFRVRVP
jgi:hypothetical protein